MGISYLISAYAIAFELTLGKKDPELGAVHDDGNEEAPQTDCHHSTCPGEPAAGRDSGFRIIFSLLAIHLARTLQPRTRSPLLRRRPTHSSPFLHLLIPRSTHSHPLPLLPRKTHSSPLPTSLPKIHFSRGRPTSHPRATAAESTLARSKASTHRLLCPPSLINPYLHLARPDLGQA